MLIVSLDNSVISKNIVNTAFIIVEPINFKLGHLVNQIKWVTQIIFVHMILQLNVQVLAQNGQK
jgi:hypothetical protein